MKYGRPPYQIQHLVTKVTSQTFTVDSLWVSINLLDNFQKQFAKSFSYLVTSQTFTGDRRWVSINLLDIFQK